MTERLPTEAKELSGTLRKSRERESIEAGAKLSELPEPAEMSERAQAYYRQLGGLCISVEVLTAADIPALVLCSKTLATADELEAAITAEGFTIEAATGGRKAHPALKALETQRNAAQRMLNDFGLSPKARKYVSKAPGPREDNPWNKYRKDRNPFAYLDDDFEPL